MFVLIETSSRAVLKVARSGIIPPSLLSEIAANIWIMVSVNNILAAFSESLGSDIIGSHCRKQAQDLREQYGSGSVERRSHVHCRQQQGVSHGSGGGGGGRGNRCKE